MTGHPASHPFRWLAWSAGIAAVMLCLTAFMLWGIHGPGILLDAIVALCM